MHAFRTVRDSSISSLLITSGGAISRAMPMVLTSTPCCFGPADDIHEVFQGEQRPALLVGSEVNGQPEAGSPHFTDTRVSFERAQAVKKVTTHFFTVFNQPFRFQDLQILQADRTADRMVSIGVQVVKQFDRLRDPG